MEKCQQASQLYLKKTRSAPLYNCRHYSQPPLGARLALYYFTFDIIFTSKAVRHFFRRRLSRLLKYSNIKVGGWG